LRTSQSSQATNFHLHYEDKARMSLITFITFAMGSRPQTNNAYKFTKIYKSWTMSTKVQMNKKEMQA